MSEIPKEAIEAGGWAIFEFERDTETWPPGTRGRTDAMSEAVIYCALPFLRKQFEDELPQRLKIAENSARQLEAVDKALPPWEGPLRDGSAECVGRVETIRNLRADRAALAMFRRKFEDEHPVLAVIERARQTGLRVQIITGATPESACCIGLSINPGIHLRYWQTGPLDDCARALLADWPPDEKPTNLDDSTDYEKGHHDGYQACWQDAMHQEHPPEGRRHADAYGGCSCAWDEHPGLPCPRPPQALS